LDAAVDDLSDRSGKEPIIESSADGLGCQDKVLESHLGKGSMGVNISGFDRRGLVQDRPGNALTDRQVSRDFDDGVPRWAIGWVLG
jgi:hypothetical protein